jgi:hypothetical protein
MEVYSLIQQDVKDIRKAEEGEAAQKTIGTHWQSKTGE